MSFPVALNPIVDWPQILSISDSFDDPQSGFEQQGEVEKVRLAFVAVNQVPFVSVGSRTYANGRSAGLQRYRLVFLR